MATATAPPSEDACRETARTIQRKRPGWLVLWGCHTETYVAFPLFSVRRRVIVTAYTPGGLLPALDEAERRYRLPGP